MLRKYVTSMNVEQFEKYGEKMLRTFSQYWPKGKIEVYTEEGELPLKDERVEYKLLYEVPGLAYFLEGVQHFPIFRGDSRGEYNYRFNVNAFARKAFAQMASAQNWSGHLFWLDADTVTTKHIPGIFLDKTLEGFFMAYMKRKTWHVCSSFVGWDCGHAFSRPWWENYQFVYASGGIFTLPQWDDAYVLEKVCEGIPNIRDLGETITGEGPYNVFDYVFQGYAHHLKGNLKHA